MRLDHYFANKIKENSDPVLRFYGWTPHCISIGYHQDSAILYKEKIGEDSLDFVRRPTGGRAIFHAAELTYSIVVPLSLIPHRELYAFMHSIIAFALNKLGYPVNLSMHGMRLPQHTHTAEDYPCFTRSVDTEIQFDGKKVVGSAQKILKYSVLQHGSILIGNEHKRLVKYLHTTDKQAHIITSELDVRTISLSDINKNHLNPEKIMTSVINILESVDAVSVYFQELEVNELTDSLKYEITV
jgi:lipoate-protein ligase A